jgi:nucleotide-binding universal stress UspA family protein
MTWTKPIVVGVDASPASAGAAAFALRIARAAGVPCHLVHAARETPLSSDAPERIVAMRAASLHALRADLERAMFNGGISRDIARGIDIRWGWPPAVLDDVVRERDAELLVLGAKHHSVLGRTLGGSTVHNVVRMLRVPLLVTTATAPPVRRVLVALDTSQAALPTLTAARHMTELFNAELRVVHAIEPLPVLPEVPPPAQFNEYEELMEQQAKQSLWPLLDPVITKTIRHTVADAAIAQEAAQWRADLVVVGSHGKGWVDRMLIGSVTERLINHLPASLLVVPVGKVAQELPVPVEACAVV